MLSFGSRPSRQEILFLTDDPQQKENVGFCSLNTSLGFCMKNAGFRFSPGWDSQEPSVHTPGGILARGKPCQTTAWARGSHGHKAEHPNLGPGTSPVEDPLLGHPHGEGSAALSHCCSPPQSTQHGILPKMVSPGREPQLQR